MSFRNISSWAIRNPVPPIVLFVALLMLGILSFFRMDVNGNVDVEFPVVFVNISQPGAAPSELETQITQRVEAAVRGVNGVEEISSSVREGNSSTSVEFVIGTPVDRATNDVRDAVTQIRGDLPEGILEPQVSRLDGGRQLAIYAVQTSDMTLEQLSWYLDNDIAKRLLSVPGMSSVDRFGGVNREIRVVLDPAAIQAQGVTAAQINQQLRQINLDSAGGRAEIAGSEQAVRVLGNADTAAQLAETQIALPGGRTARLGDLAQVIDGNSEQRSISKLNGRQIVSFGITRAKGASDVTVYEDVVKELRKIEADSDGRITFNEIYTEVDSVVLQYESSLEMLWEGALLAVVVVFLFLRDWRATLISAVAIPLSAIPTFWFLDLLGFTLNFLSLLALSLVAGVLVDDAIVEIENIVRHMRMGKSAYQASIDAADEIGLAVLATTLAIVAVFLPVGLMPGFSGQFFKNFGFTVVAAVLMSLAVARLITPLMAAYLLKSHGPEPHGENALMRAYLASLHFTLRHRWVTVVAGIASLALTAMIFSTFSFTFLPPEDRDFSQVRIFLPPGTTRQQAEQVATQARTIVETAPEVVQVVERVNVGSANLNLTLDKDRERTSIEIERDLAPKLSAIADARVNFQSQSQGGPEGGGGGGRDITLNLGGDDPALLTATANRIAEEMGALPELRAARVQGDLVRPEIVIRPRLDLAADLGVTTAALGQTIRLATLGDIDQNSAKFSLNDRQVPIRVALPESARRDLDTLENLPVPTVSGGSVPLKSVAEVSFGAGPTTVQRTNQVRRISVGADLAPGLVSGDVWPKIYALPSMKNLPRGVAELKLGDSKWQAELIQNFIVALVSGVLLVFAVLVLLYKRVLVPLVNMGSLLLAPLGAAVALYVTGNPMSLPVFIGLLMLLGIVAKNSILLIDFAIEEMDKGVDKDTAIIDAGHKRAQPIVMTTVAMVAGMVPVALSLSGDGSFRAPMGITVIGGLIFSTILTLLILPGTFSLAVEVESWLGRKLGRMLVSDERDRVPAAHGSLSPQPAE
ncbi:MAG: RND multidrug efflux transporter; Acriflavin resistance protein [uncultured Sphingomonadaceae bacterium]|uniref:RND multidrug efflux transporter Acriflavin resistance protein n=1 Tax=uncultured Sphingomonadaceae bacterium TaxID=169976 RepID=A0A6J4SF72_9SPHN|nr:MAG: RND multidrug efflux transporter; Acriflavin resistance protein [uncultured Sphingomonadaceae bacterium]